MPKDDTEILHPNFIVKGKLYLVKCPKCNKENYAINISLGICTWCQLDGYNYYNLKR